MTWSPVVDAAIAHVSRWIDGGPPPPSQRPISMDGTPLAIRRDDDGNTLGGVRTPDLVVPIASHQGTEDTPDPLRALAGVTRPFAPERLKELYPTHPIYVSKVAAAAAAARDAGVIPAYAEAAYVASAKAAAVPS